MAKKGYSFEEKQKILKDICKEISQGESVRKILLRSDMPCNYTFYLWLEESKVFAEQYARACNERTELMADEILEIADENNADVYLDDEGMAKIDGNTVQRSRLKIDARKWLMSKQNPKKYGDKMELNIKESPMTPEERKKRIAELKDKLKTL